MTDAPSPTADEARAAIKHIQHVLNSMPVLYFGSEHHPADHLIAAIGCIEALSRVPSEEATEEIRIGDVIELKKDAAKFARAKYVRVKKIHKDSAFVEARNDEGWIFIEKIDLRRITRAPGAGNGRP